MQVADDAVGFDWLVGHFLTGLSKIGLKRGRDHFRHSERKSQFQAGAHSQGQVPLPASGLRQSLSLRSRASASTKLSFELAGSRLGGATLLALDDPMNSLDQCSREPRPILPSHRRGSVPLYPSKKTSGFSCPALSPRGALDCTSPHSVGFAIWHSNVVQRRPESTLNGHPVHDPRTSDSPSLILEEINDRECAKLSGTRSHLCLQRPSDQGRL